MCVYLCVRALQCQAVQDVAKAVSLFESTGRIPATVMEARYSLGYISPPAQFAVKVGKTAEASSCLHSQYFQEALLLDAIPPSSAGSKSGENIHRPSVFFFFFDVPLM